IFILPCRSGICKNHFFSSFLTFIATPISKRNNRKTYQTLTKKGAKKSMLNKGASRSVTVGETTCVLDIEDSQSDCVQESSHIVRGAERDISSSCSRYIGIQDARHLDIWKLLEGSDRRLDIYKS